MFMKVLNTDDMKTILLNIFEGFYRFFRISKRFGRLSEKFKKKFKSQKTGNNSELDPKYFNWDPQQYFHYNSVIFTYAVGPKKIKIKMFICKEPTEAQFYHANLHTYMSLSEVITKREKHQQS